MANIYFAAMTLLTLIISSVNACKHCTQSGNGLLDLNCQQCTQNGNGNVCGSGGSSGGRLPGNTGGANGRRPTRAATNMIQELLLTFDVKLTEELANEMNEMNVSEKEEFLQDLLKMNEAAEAEYKSLRGSKISMSQQEIIKTVADRVSRDFSNKKWFKRLQSLAGDKITHLVNNANN